jgi:hypothetical protein
VGLKYYYNYLKRNGNIIESAKPFRKDVNRKEWGKWNNIKRMYDALYELLAEKGIAVKLDNPVWMDLDGNIVQSEDEAYGGMVAHQILHPDRWIHLDETGCNTNMKPDGKVGGKHYIGESGVKIELSAAINDIRFTLLPLINSNGDAVCCVLIFQSDAADIPIGWKFGIDVTATTGVDITVDDGEFLDGQVGTGKLMPQGPTCHVNGVDIPCYDTHSPHGGITSQILADVLGFLDSLEVFPRGNGLPDPMLLLDGHNS